MSREEVGRVGARARHDISSEEESRIAQRAAQTRKDRDPDAFREMGRKGGRSSSSERHSGERRGRESS